MSTKNFERKLFFFFEAQYNEVVRTFKAQQLTLQNITTEYKNQFGSDIDKKSILEMGKRIESDLRFNIPNFESLRKMVNDDYAMVVEAELVKNKTPKGIRDSIIKESINTNLWKFYSLWKEFINLWGTIGLNNLQYFEIKNSQPILTEEFLNVELREKYSTYIENEIQEKYVELLNETVKNLNELKAIMDTNGFSKNILEDCIVQSDDKFEVSPNLLDE